jgi:hypothetical protein
MVPERLQTGTYYLLSRMGPYDLKGDVGCMYIVRASRRQEQTSIEQTIPS